MVEAYVEGLPIPKSSNFLTKLASLYLAGGFAKTSSDFKVSKFNGSDINEVAIVESIDESKYLEYIGSEFGEHGRLELGDQVLSIDERYFRPTEVELLIGDPTKSKTKLNWQPKYDLKGLIEEMVKSDVQLFQSKL